MEANGPPPDDIPDREDLQGEYHSSSIEPDEPPCNAVINAVAALSGNEPHGLEPLYDAVDPDALDALVSKSSSSVYIQFTYAGYEVVIADDTVYLRQRNHTPTPDS